MKIYTEKGGGSAVQRMPIAVFVVLACVYIVASSAFSYYSPGGLWGNTILGIGFTGESDPGGNYIVSAHQIFDADGHNIYLGHPGITLQLVLGFIQKCMYYLGSDGSTSYSQYIANNLDKVYFISKVVMGVFSFVSLVCVYLLSRCLGLACIGAMSATVGYATSLPALYYASRISVEALMIIFLSITITSLVKGMDVLESESSRTRLFNMYIFLAGVTSSLAFYTKANLMGPLPFISLLYLVGVTKRKRFSIKKTINILVVYVLGFAVMFYALLPFISWKYFFTTWSSPGIIPATQSQQNVLVSLLSVGNKIVHIFSELSASFSRLELGPQATLQGIFNLLETTYILCSLVGLFLLFKNKKINFEYILLFAIVVWTIILWWYRGTTRFQLSWHYLFCFIVAASVLFGYFVEVVFGRINRTNHSPARYIYALFIVLMLHYPSVACCIKSRIADVKYYNSYSGPLFNDHRYLKTGEKIAALCFDDNDFARITIYHGLDASYSFNKKSTLLEEIPISAISIKKYFDNKLLYRDLMDKKYSYILDFVNGYSSVAEIQPISHVLDSSFWIRPEKKLSILSINNSLLPPDDIDSRAIFDGSPGTQWYSTASSEPTLCLFDVNLGKMFIVTKIKIFSTQYEKLLPIDLEIYSGLTSEKDSQVYSLEKINAQPSSWFEISLKPFQAQSVRIQFITPKHFSANHYQAALAEIEIYGIEKYQ